MWLGFSAAFIGILYALLKFLTVHRVKHLKEELIQVHHEVQKTNQRLEFLREKLGIAQSKKRTLDRETAHLREVVENSTPVYNPSFHRRCCPSWSAAEPFTQPRAAVNFSSSRNSTCPQRYPEPSAPFPC